MLVSGSAMRNQMTEFSPMLEIHRIQGIESKENDIVGITGASASI
jgi:hypothetical protein